MGLFLIYFYIFLYFSFYLRHLLDILIRRY